MPISECPIQSTSTAAWGDGELIRIQWDGIWYGKRLAYENYLIYVFYPSSEVFDNMLPVVTTAVAIYALVCMILLLLRHASEKKYQQREKKQLNTIRAISTLFVTTSIVHLDDNTIEGIISTPRAREILDETTDAHEVAVKLAERVIAPEDGEAYVAFLDTATMADRLQGKPSISNICRDVDGIWFAVYLIPMEYGPAGRLKQVLFASRDIDHFMKK